MSEERNTDYDGVALVFTSALIAVLLFPFIVKILILFLIWCITHPVIALPLLAAPTVIILFMLRDGE